jgi:hypothetical protein
MLKFLRRTFILGNVSAFNYTLRLITEKFTLITESGLPIL